jgi:NAD(P)H dehydrogenase (quinone)
MAGRATAQRHELPLCLSDFASPVEGISGKRLPYRNMPPDDLRQALLAAGVPEKVAMIWSDTDAGVARRALFESGGDLSSLIGRPTTPFQETIVSFLKGQPEAAHG